jgi:hypothetical protein
MTIQPSNNSAPSKNDSEVQYDEKEAQRRFQVALKGAMNTSPKPLKEKPKVKKVAKESKKRSVR